MTQDEKQEIRDKIVGLRRLTFGYTAIADQLNREGVPTFGGGSRWHAGTVRGIVLASDPEAAAMASTRRDGEEGAVYGCGCCGREASAAEMVHSHFTGARYCGDFNACRARAAANVEQIEVAS